MAAFVPCYAWMSWLWYGILWMIIHLTTNASHSGRRWRLLTPKGKPKVHFLWTSNTIIIHEVIDICTIITKNQKRFFRKICINGHHWIISSDDHGNAGPKGRPDGVSRGTCLGHRFLLNKISIIMKDYILL